MQLPLVVAVHSGVRASEGPESSVTVRFDHRLDETYDAVAVLTSGMAIPIDAAR